MPYPSLNLRAGYRLFGYNCTMKMNGFVILKALKGYLLATSGVQAEYVCHLLKPGWQTYSNNHLLQSAAKYNSGLIK